VWNNPSRVMGTVSSSGVEIHYEVEGDGPPLIMHTGGGGDLDMWRLAGYTHGLPGRRLILMDHRGLGKSGRPRDVAQHGIDLYVRDVLAVADDAGEVRFSFFGYSAGAAIGYRLAAEHPDRIVSLVGLGAVGPPPPRQGNLLETAARIRREGSEELVRWLREEEPDFPGWFADQMRSTDPEMFALSIEAWATWGGPWAEFHRVAAPILIVVGQLEEDDRVSAADHARQAAASLRNGRVVVLPDLGHVMAFVRADLVLPHVLAFLNETAAGNS
jgi:pimeloyl-ACP methyl ester carboxylesterase